MTTTKELRPYYNELAKILFELKTVSGNEGRESLLESGFSKIFPDVSYDVRQQQAQHTIGDQNEPKIMIRENDKVYPIEESSAGYFEVLYLLSNIVHAQDSFLILDEPALHLHPPKIRQLAKALKELVVKSGNQVLLITHSPYFIDYSMVSAENKTSGMVYIKKQKEISKVFYKPQDFEFGLKPHLFKPEIFFSKCNILVEGPADYATLAAISDRMDNFLDEHDIALLDVGGKGNIKRFILLFETYGIPHIAMVDNDYTDPIQVSKF